MRVLWVRLSSPCSFCSCCQLWGTTCCWSRLSPQSFAPLAWSSATERVVEKKSFGVWHKNVTNRAKRKNSRGTWTRRWRLLRPFGTAPLHLGPGMSATSLWNSPDDETDLPLHRKMSSIQWTFCWLWLSSTCCCPHSGWAAGKGRTSLCRGQQTRPGWCRPPRPPPTSPPSSGGPPLPPPSTCASSASPLSGWSGTWASQAWPG